MQKNLLKNIDGKIDEKKKLKEKIILTNPNNPSGTTLPKEEMEKIAEILENKQELKTRILRQILENPEEENDLQKILDDVKNEVKILEKNYEEIKEKLEYLNKKEE